MPEIPVAGPSATITVAAGTTAGAALRDSGHPNKGPEAIVVVRDADGTLRDLSWAPEADTVVEPVAANTEDGRSVIRHSAAHVLAQAVQDLNPKAKLGIGPPIENGFYYDFDVEEPFTPEDLTALEKKMKQIIKSGQRFSRRVYDSLDEAKAELADEPYKLELVDDKGSADDPEVMEVGGGELTAYDNLNPRTGEKIWGDLCRGPHVPTTKYISAFKLTRSSAAYWRGNQDNADLQRVYGTAWESAEAQDAYLELLAEAEKRDHRKLGAELDLFSFPDALGSGLPVFHPKGGIIRKELEDYSRQRHIDEGYEFVNTPHITKSHLYEISGHLDWYRDGMFPAMHLDAELDENGEVRKPGQDYYLKPMNCPMHNLIFNARGRSYRELPLRLFEFGSVYRYEKSGVDPRPDPRARHDAGRRPHLLHQRADARRADLHAELRARSAQGLRPRRLLPRTLDPQPGEVRRLRRDLGRGDRHARRGRRGLRPASGARPGRRRVLRPEDLGAGQGRARPQLADVDDPARLQPARAVRAGVHRLRRLQAPSGDDPPRAVRIHRTVLRCADRALRGCVPGLAVAGAGGGYPGRRRLRAAPGRGRGDSSSRTVSGPRSISPTTGCRRRSATTRRARCRSCCWPANATWRPAR